MDTTSVDRDNGVEDQILATIEQSSDPVSFSTVIDGLKIQGLEEDRI